jgi:hypothetical protein
MAVKSVEKKVVLTVLTKDSLTENLRALMMVVKKGNPKVDLRVD